MQLIITNVNSERRIHAIKGVRAVTGLGLREAKLVVDRVADGTPTRVTAADPWTLTMAETLMQHDVMFTVAEPGVGVDFLRATLERMPQHLTVADVLQVLDALL